MKNSEILECCEAVVEFLENENVDWRGRNLSFSVVTMTPEYHKMIEVIRKYEMGDMISFTKYLNNKYKIYPDPLWEATAKEFFATDKGINFYKTIVRDIKINQVLK